MADASSSDTTSDYYNDYYSDNASEKSEFFIVGQKPSFTQTQNKRNFLQKLFTRETRGCVSSHNYAKEEKLFSTVPSWRRLLLLHTIPKSALELGHIVMGLTQCGQFLLTYTYTLDVSGNTSLYKYLLHWWAFTPNQVSRKVAEVTLFGNYTIHRELSIVISQWPMERDKLIIHGLCKNWLPHQPTDRAYLTITTLPSLQNCKDCLKVAASYEEEGEELAANWDSCIQCNCLQHGLTVHTTYEVISPYPRFRAPVCLNYWNHIVVNTGNFLHVLRVDLNIPEKKNSTDKQDNIVLDSVPLDISDCEDPINTKVERFVNTDQKFIPLECNILQSPSHESNVEPNSSNGFFKISDKHGYESPTNTSNSNQSDCNCDNNKFNETINVKVCDCLDNSECKCRSKISTTSCVEQQAISVRDKILQDFCDDMSQELNIGTDLITLVKHPSCSPKPVPQRLPSDLKPTTWSSSLNTPPSDILRTRNTESSQRSINSQRAYSPQPGASGDTGLTPLSPLHFLSLSPSSSCPRRLITRSFRHHSPRRRSNLHSPPPSLPSTQSRTTRATHKLTLEAEKAYEFTDEAHEICEKLSLFRKRRLADKKYEFCDETEDAENIIPFKHIRDQTKRRTCSIYQVPSTPVVSPVLINSKKHWADSDQSETDECSASTDFTLSNELLSPDSEKSVLRPLNQNQLTNGSLHRDRCGKLGTNSSPIVPQVNLHHPTIKCTAHFRRSYIELDDEMISVITDVEDEETGGYVSYQCVLPMHVHGSGYVQMQMVSNSKAEKLMIPHVTVNQLSFDIETFSHHIADWICTKFKKRYWHCSDYDIEIIDVCALTGDVICLLVMKIQASELSSQTQCPQERKQYEVGCTFTWNINSNQYTITDVLPMEEVNYESWKPNYRSPLWNPTRFMAPLLRKKIQQPYARSVRFLHNEMSVTLGESISRLYDLDNLVEFYITPLPNYP